MSVFPAIDPVCWRSAAAQRSQLWSMPDRAILGDVGRGRGPFFPGSSLGGGGFELGWGFSCQVVVLVCCRFFVRRGKAVLRPVACDQVRGARGRGQGTETVAQLGGVPPSEACVSQRLDA